MEQSRRTALIAGVTGIAGLNLARKMLSTDKYGQWTVYGLSRRTSKYLPAEVNHICCDLLDVALCKKLLEPLSDVTHVFYTTWIDTKQKSDKAEANSAMLKNLLNNLPTKPQHVVLLTGMMHYFTFEAFVAGRHLPTPYKESMERLPGENFYYNLEDIVSETAEKQGYTWSVARPGVITGFAPFNQINFGTSVAVYAAICKYAGRPFYYPGNQSGYNCLFDVTDAELLAEHMLWEATEPIARNQAYNVSNGGVSRMKQIWKVIGNDFDLEVPDEIGKPLDHAELEPIWRKMVEEFGLQPLKLEEISSLGMSQQILKMPFDFFADVTKSREHGFLVYQNNEKTFLKLFEYLRENNFIPKKATN